VYNNAAYRTLDDAPAKGGKLDNPNRGCQCSDFGANGEGWDNCLRPETTNYLPLPPGYELAPNDADSVAVIAAHGWSTQCAVLADGTAWYSAGIVAGMSCGSATGNLATSGDTYTVTSCPMQALARCG